MLKNNILLVLGTMVATIVVTFFFQTIYSFKYVNEVSLTDILSLLLNGILAIYIGTTFVRLNDKDKSIRDFYIKETISFFDKAKNDIEEIKGIHNDFVFPDTIVHIQNLRDQIEYLILLNESLLHGNTLISNKLNDLSKHLREIDLKVNSGIGTTNQATLLMMHNDYDIIVYDFRRDFSILLKLIS